MKTDRERLVDAINAEGGALSLREGRVTYDLQPTVVGYLCRCWPEDFISYTEAGHGHVKLRNPSDLHRRIFANLKGCPDGRPVHRLKLWQHCTGVAIHEFVDQNADAVELVIGKTKLGQPREVVALKRAGLPTSSVPQAPAIPPGVEFEPAACISSPEEQSAPESAPVKPESPPKLADDLIADTQKLFLYLSLGWRMSEWLEAAGLPFARVQEIAAANPGRLLISPGQIGIYTWKVELIPQPEPAPEEAKPATKQPPVHEWPLSPEETKKVIWKPASRYMAAAKGLRPEQMLHRRRNPLPGA